MLINNRHTNQCINCGHNTVLVDTNTNHPICSDDCIDDLWANNNYKNQRPIGEHNEYLFG